MPNANPNAECKDGNWRALDYPKEGSNDWGLHNQGGSW